MPQDETASPQQSVRSLSSRSASLTPPGPVASFSNSQARRPAGPRTSLNHSQHTRHESVHVLITEYLKMVEKEQHVSNPTTLDSPKGLTKAFLLLCPATDALDLMAASQVLGRALAALSHLVVFTSFLLVPAWLWLARHLFLSGRAPAAALCLALGLLLFYIADLASRTDILGRVGRRRGVFTADSMVPHTSSRSSQASSQSRGAAGGAVSPASSPSKAAGGSRARSAAIGPSPLRPRDDALVHHVKQSVIRLEAEVFGNTVTEGTLPLDSLPQRVQKLCEEIGVPYTAGSGLEAGGARGAGVLEHLDSLLKEVAAQVGVNTQQ